MNKLNWNFFLIFFSLISKLSCFLIMLENENMDSSFFGSWKSWFSFLIINVIIMATFYFKKKEIFIFLTSESQKEIENKKLKKEIEKLNVTF